MAHWDAKEREKMEKISLSEYKKYYFDTEKCIPGEHHFVAVYLLNKFKKFLII